MKTLSELRDEYDNLLEMRWQELDVPEELKKLKTPEFVRLEREIGKLCNQEKARLGYLRDDEFGDFDYNPAGVGMLVKRVCEFCGKEFFRYASMVSIGRGRFCNPKCNKDFRNFEKRSLAA